MKIAKKALAILLSLILVFSFVPTAFASEATEVNTEREVYYTDLFFGYSHYLKNATVLTDYHENSYNILRGIYDDFLDSSTYDLSFIKETINKGTSFKDLAKIIGDALGVTDFTYEGMLDGANELFVQQMLGGEGADAGYAACADIANVLKDVHGVVNAIEDKYDPDTMTENEFFSSVVDALVDSKLLDKIPDESLTKIVEDVHKGISTGATFVNVGTSIIGFAKSFAVAISMENLRVELVSEILASAPVGTVLYDGMQRLYNQLSQEFHTYFISNYLVPEILSEIFDKVVSKATEDALGDAKGALGLALGVIKILNMVVFDVILEVPNLSDLTTQQVLIAYSAELYNCLQGIQFDDLTTVYYNAKKFERMFIYYKASVNAAIDNCEKIAIDSNRSQLARLKEAYYNTDIYTATVNQAKATIKNTPEKELVVTKYSDVFKPTTISESGYLLEATDERFSDCPYNGYCIFTPENGIKAYLTLSSCSFVVPEGHSVRINDTINLYGVTDRDATVLTVFGELSCKQLNLMGYEHGWGVSKFYNYGVLRLVYDVRIVDLPLAEFYQDKKATMYLGGCFYDKTDGDATVEVNGTVVYNGTSTQVIEAGVPQTVIIRNDYIKFYCPVKATTLFDHGGHIYYLYAGGNTFVDYDKDGIPDDDDNFPTEPNDCVITVKCDTPEYCIYLGGDTQTAKGDIAYIYACADSGYRIDKWVDSAGNLISKQESFEIVVTGSETYTVSFIPLIVGDLDGDQIINSVDIAELRKDIMWVESPAPWETKDINGDYWVNVRDLVRLKKMAAGIL